MRNYGKIESAFWQNKKIRPISDEAKLLLLYLYSCPHGNSVGCFVLPEGYICADMGWPPERVTERVTELVSKGFIEHEKGTHLLRIIGWFDHNTIENENVAKAAIKAIKILPDSSIISNLIKEVKSHDNRFMNMLANAFGNTLLNEFAIPEPEPNTIYKTDFQKIFDAGIEVFPNLIGSNSSVIHQWIVAGCDLEKDFLPELRRHRELGKSVNAWSYLHKAMLQAIQTRKTPPPPVEARKSFQNKKTHQPVAHARVL